MTMMYRLGQELGGWAIKSAKLTPGKTLLIFFLVVGAAIQVPMVPPRQAALAAKLFLAVVVVAGHSVIGLGGQVFLAAMVDKVGTEARTLCPVRSLVAAVVARRADVQETAAMVLFG